ncbi:MAG: hypothetical protein DRR19_17860 [Candidatus Parabeggiatoa sp. nov. 1]|nr:MAG: hypothetical protein DRR19_17860 [Gammaproteobacteria bacterium]
MDAAKRLIRPTKLPTLLSTTYQHKQMRYPQLSIKKDLLKAGLTLAVWLCAVTLVNVSYAFPSDLEIAFAKASKWVETKKANVTARCIIVWPVGDLNTPKDIYCTYFYQGTVLCDKPNGIQFDKIRLDDALKMKDNLTLWFNSKYPAHHHQITDEEKGQILVFMSNEALGLTPIFGDKLPHTVYLSENNFSDHSLPNKSGLYHDIPQKKFALLVHRSIPKKLAEIDAKKASITPAMTTSSTQAIPRTVLTTDNRPAEPNNWINADNQPAEPNNGINLPNIYLIILGISIILILAIIWFLFRKRDAHESQVSQMLVEKYPYQFPEQPPIWVASDDSIKNTPHSEPQQKRHFWKKNALKDKLKVEQQKNQALTNTLKDKLKAEQDKNQVLTTSLKNTEAEKNKLSEQYGGSLAQHQHAENCLTEANEQIQTLCQSEQALRQVLRDRFWLMKPNNLKFLDWITALIEQPDVWRWLQSALSVELLVCGPIVNHIKHNGSKKEQQILELLHLDNMMKHWSLLAGQLFESNQKLWRYLHDIDGGNWLNHLLRAEDVLQTYFVEEESFTLLSSHLSIVKSNLQAAFVEMGITFLSPKILEAVPNYIPQKNGINYVYTPSPILKALVKPQVQKRFKEVPQFVVDVERYGFGTAKNPDATADVRVFVSSPAEWE